MTDNSKARSILTSGLTRRNFLQVGAYGALGAVIAACGNGTSTTTLAPGTTVGGTPTTGATATTVGGGGAPMANRSDFTLGTYNPNYATQWTFQLAEYKGWLAEYGITEHEFILSEEYLPGLIGGSLNMAHGDTDEFFGANAAGQDVIYLANFRDKEWEMFGVAPGIDTPEDLIGKNVSGGSLGSRNELILRRIIEEDLGVDISQVNFVPTSGGSDGRLQAMLGGSLDGSLFQLRHKAAVEEFGGKFLYEDRVEVPQDGYAVMRSTLEADRDTLVAWFTAELRARQYIYDLDNQDEILGIMRELGFDIPQEFEDVYVDTVEQLGETGGFQVESMERLVDQFKALEILPEDFVWQDACDFTVLWEAQDNIGIERTPVL